MDVNNIKQHMKIMPDYWAELASNNFHWETPFDKNNVLSYVLPKVKVYFIKWFEDHETNICYNK